MALNAEMRTSGTTHVYRSDVVSHWCRGIALVTVAVALLFLLSPGNKVLAMPFEGLLLVFAAWIGLKLPRCGIYIEDDGVQVINPVSTVYLKWPEIDRFEFKPYGSCRIRLVHGQPLAIVGIQQSAWAARRGTADTQTAQLIDKLNTLLDSERPGSHSVA